MWNVPYFNSICKNTCYRWSSYFVVLFSFVCLQATEKLVVFMLGFISHQVADVSWHSLGIDQGFLDTMGKVCIKDIFHVLFVCLFVFLKSLGELWLLIFKFWFLSCLFVAYLHFEHYPKGEKKKNRLKPFHYEMTAYITLWCPISCLIEIRTTQPHAI